MNKTKIFNEVLTAVSDVTGVSSQAIIHSGKETDADARYVLVIVLSRCLTDTEIAVFLCRTRQGVAFIRNNSAKGRKYTVATDIGEVGKSISFK